MPLSSFRVCWLSCTRHSREQRGSEPSALGELGRHTGGKRSRGGHDWRHKIGEKKHKWARHSLFTSQGLRWFLSCAGRDAKRPSRKQLRNEAKESLGSSVSGRRKPECRASREEGPTRVLKPLENNSRRGKGQQRQSSLLYREKESASQGRPSHPKSRHHFPYSIGIEGKLGCAAWQHVSRDWKLEKVSQILEILDFKLLIYSR